MPCQRYGILTELEHIELVRNGSLILLAIILTIIFIIITILLSLALVTVLVIALSGILRALDRPHASPDTSTHSCRRDGCGL